MGFRVGDLVELSKLGSERFEGKARGRRKQAVVLNESRFDGCFRVEWDGLATPETIHEDFIKIKTEG